MIALNPSEHFEQVTLVKWLELKGIVFFAVPNGGKRWYKWDGFEEGQTFVRHFYREMDL